MDSHSIKLRRIWCGGSKSSKVKQGHVHLCISCPNQDMENSRLSYRTNLHKPVQYKPALPHTIINKYNIRVNRHNIYDTQTTHSIANNPSVLSMLYSNLRQCAT